MKSRYLIILLTALALQGCFTIKIMHVDTINQNYINGELMEEEAELTI